MFFDRVNGKYQFRVGSEENSDMIRFRSAFLIAILVVTVAVTVGFAMSSV